MRILVCGGREFTDREAVFAALDNVNEARGVSTVIHGNARGADRFALEWARERGVEHEGYPANWARYGPAAGPIRNQLMLDVAGPEYVVAFPGGVGTADMIRRAKKAGLPVWEPLGGSS